MKRIAPILALFIIVLVSCKETDSLVNEAANEKMKNTIYELYPTTKAGHVSTQVHDFKDVVIILGDKELYNEPEEKKQEIVNTLANKTYEMYNDNNYLDKGKIIFTSVEDRMHTSNDPVKEYDMHLQDVIKANKK